MKHSLRSLSIATIATSIAVAPSAPAQVSVQPDCLGSIDDAAAPGNCINASTLPTGGMLLPLGPELFVNPTGEVGINTMSPAYTLDVAGDLRTSQRAAFGNLGTIGPNGDWTRFWEFDQMISDFSSAQNWGPFQAISRLDPAVDLTGPGARYVYGQVLGTYTQNGNDKDFEFLQGVQQNTVFDGTGSVGIMGGVFSGAQNNHGHVDFMGALSGYSIGRFDATTFWNAGGEFWSGHYDAGNGVVTNDYGVYVYTPWTGGELTNHYGIFLEDQDVGQQDSYAIYSEGGTTYLAGDLGIGTDTPTVALDVVGDFAATGTKSFVQPHPVDPTKEIRFVCLEGNEAGTYFRGKSQLIEGLAVIEVPEDFRLVTEEDGVTVQVTAMGPRAGLWVESYGLDRIVVRGERDVDFHYFVNGIRRGYADFEVIRDREVRETNASRPGRPDVRAIRGQAALRSGENR